MENGLDDRVGAEDERLLGWRNSVGIELREDLREEGGSEGESQRPSGVTLREEASGEGEATSSLKARALRAAGVRDEHRSGDSLTTEKLTESDERAQLLLPDDDSSMFRLR